MPKNNNILLHRIFGIILSVSIIAAGICLICACLSIYYDGNGYSHEAVKNAFSPIAVPVFICLGLMAASFIFSFFIPLEETKNKTKAYHYTLALIRSKRDEKNGEASVISAIEHQRKQRFTVKLVQIIVFLICCAVFLIYALNPANYHDSDINGSVIRGMYVMLPCLAVSFLLGLFGILFCEKSMKKEIELIKKLPVSKVSEENSTKHSSKTASLIIKLVIILAGAALLVYGAFAGGTADVLTKAVNICTECIGLG